MLGFTPFKSHPNKFNYTPRYYDPEKEAREQRRAELRGERAGDGEYEPGKDIRAQREARARRRNAAAARSQGKLWLMVLAAAVLVLFVLLVYPRIVAAFRTAGRETPATEQQEEVDPYAPITVVPNDYEQE